MTKHRLEIFSDGVFAIVLTLLVLDLRLPQAHGAASLREIAPELVVHAGGFFIVGAFWINHHKVLTRITEITGSTLLLNLVALFWITLAPPWPGPTPGSATSPPSARSPFCWPCPPPPRRG